MTNAKLSKIKAMINAGFSDEQIEENLNVTKADIYAAIADEQPAKKEEEKAKRGATPENLEKARAASVESKRKKARETYEKYKGLLDDWTLSYDKFAKKYGIGATTAWRIAHSATAEDYISGISENNANAKKKLAEKPFKKNWAKTKTKSKETNAKEYVDPKLVEFRSMADSLARIAEAFEKIAEQPKKRGLFRR